MASKINSSYFATKFILKSLFVRRISPGTIITGSPRSGTTLALRVYCPNLNREEEIAGSAVNEPQPMSTLFVLGKRRTALFVIPLTMNNRYRLIKSPHISFLLPYFDKLFKVIVCFRDLRLILPSIFGHRNSDNLYVPRVPYWAKFMKIDVPDDPILKAVTGIKLFYYNILEYRGFLEIWNYGFWDEWTVNNLGIEHLYPRNSETSSGVIKDIGEGIIFSNQRFSLRVWKVFCEQAGISSRQESAVNRADRMIKNKYMKKGYTLKTLDDI